MLEQIVKDLADTVKINVQAGMKALTERFEPMVEALESSQAEIKTTVEASASSIIDLNKSVSDIEKQIEAISSVPVNDDLAQFAKAFTEEMNGA